MSNKNKYLYLFNHKAKNRIFLLSRQKIILLLAIIILFLGGAVYLGVEVLYDTLYQSRVAQIRQKNHRLVSTIHEMKTRMKKLESDVNVLYSKDKALRTYIDIPTIDKDIRRLGIGGKVIHETTDLDQFIPGDSLHISDLSENLDKLERAIKLERISYEAIYDAFRHRSDQIRSTPSIRPVNKGYISDGFGYRRDPFTGRRRFHYGVDISAPMGTKVFATADGVIRDVHLSRTYGKVIRIDNGFGYTTFFAHLSKVLVDPGQVIKRGEVIGEVGNTGRSTGPHLHYEVRQFNVKKDPLNYFFTGYIP